MGDLLAHIFAPIIESNRIQTEINMSLALIIQNRNLQNIKV